MKTIISAFFLVITLNAFTQISEKGLIAYYPFTGNANDNTMNGFNGIIHGTTPVADRFGKKKSAISFDGEDDYIDLSQFVESLNFKEPATISFWIKTEMDAPQSIFSISDSTNNVYGIMALYVGNFTTSTLADELICCANRRDASDDYITGYTTTNRSLLLDNNWHQIVFVFDEEVCHIYLDNNELPLTDYKTNSGHFANFTSANKVLIGTRYSNGNGAFFNGSLDELRIYNRALDRSEISNLFFENVTYFNSMVDAEALIINNSEEVEQEQYPPSIIIYPNNLKDHLYINADQDYIGYKVKIINSSNKVVYKKTIELPQYEIDLSTWTGKGIYFVQIFDIKGNILDIKKIVLQ
jgi:hypothetical protein